MPLEPIAKKISESCTPRPEKRHYVDYLAQELESKIITTNLKAKTDRTTYKHDFIQQDEKLMELSKVPRRLRRIWDMYSAPLADLDGLNQTVSELNVHKQNPGMKDADSILYKTSYQMNYDDKEKSGRPPRFHYFGNSAVKYSEPVHDKTPVSSYNGTFNQRVQFDPKALNNPDRRHAMTKLLYQARTTGLTAKEIFEAAKLKDKTSYKFDYQDLSQFVPSTPPPLPEPVPVKGINRAIKYRKWTSS